jgi:hypothetical protein
VQHGEPDDNPYFEMRFFQCSTGSSRVATRVGRKCLRHVQEVAMYRIEIDAARSLLRPGIAGHAGL